MNISNDQIFLLIVSIIAFHVLASIFGSLKITEILEELPTLKKISWHLFIWLIPIVGIVALNFKSRLKMSSVSHSGASGYAEGSGGDGGC